MASKIGINGFGRIGRIVLRIMCENPETFDIRGINLRKADIDYMVYLLKYDSVFRNFPGMVEHAGGDLIVNGHKIKVFSESDAAMIKWSECEAEYIIESTGANNTTDKASRHFKGGAKKVILTAPAKDDATPTFVYGVNSDEYRSDMKVISNASCTTNCLAPLAYVIHKTFGIEQSLMSTIHASAADQKAAESRGGSDWRTGRSILNNNIPTPTFVMGVNHLKYEPTMDVVSNASCTTNCLAPMTKVINDTFGIKQALMSTIHAATAKQKAVDSRAGRDWRTGRSVLGNIIPSSTGAAKAVGEVIPELKGKMTGMSFRVPTNDVSVVDLTARLIQPASYHDVCVAMENAAQNSMKGIITCTSDQVVSSDLTGFSQTCIFDETAGIMLDDDFVKLIAWYDNEWGYTNKLLDLIAHMYEVDSQG